MVLQVAAHAGQFMHRGDAQTVQEGAIAHTGALQDGRRASTAPAAITTSRRARATSGAPPPSGSTSTPVTRGAPSASRSTSRSVAPVQTCRLSRRSRSRAGFRKALAAFQRQPLRWFTSK